MSGEITQVFTYVNEDHSNYVYTADVEVTCTMDEGTYDTPGSCDNEAEVLSIERMDESGNIVELRATDPEYPEIYNWAYDRGMGEDNFDL